MFHYISSAYTGIPDFKVKKVALVSKEHDVQSCPWEMNSILSSGNTWDFLRVPSTMKTLIQQIDICQPHSCHFAHAVKYAEDTNFQEHWSQYSILWI